MTKRRSRTAWVSYLRVSTPGQADRELSLPAQRSAIEQYARQRGATIIREYVEPGASGTNPHRPEFRRMLEDTFRPGSDVHTIVVHHTSRFTRDATEARVVKAKLAKVGARVVSVCQDLHDDPIGKLMEGFFECIDQYESQINGLRTAAAMREAVRQGFFPGSLPPYGFESRPVELRPGVVRHLPVPNDKEADIVREIFRLYVADNGTKAVARSLNRRGARYRTGALWDKKRVMAVLDQSAVAGVYRWGRHVNRPSSRKTQEVIELKVPPLVDPEVFRLVQQLRAARDPKKKPGRGASPAHVLSGLVRCGRCGAAYQLETSGKRMDDGVYRYSYYNCRSFCRGGKELCAGHRVPTAVLDAAVLEHIAAATCTPARAERLGADLVRTHQQARWHRRERLRDALARSRERIAEWNVALAHPGADQGLARARLEPLHREARALEADLRRDLQASDTLSAAPVTTRVAEVWSSLITHDPQVGRSYAQHLLDHVDVYDDRVVVVPRGLTEGTQERTG